MALEDLLREACVRGLTHLSLSPTPSVDGKKVYWLATATPSTVHKYISTSSLDPVEAVEQVLSALPKAPKRPPRTGDAIDKVTAAVIPTDEELREDLKDFTNTSPPPATEQPQSEIDKWLPKT